MNYPDKFVFNFKHHDFNLTEAVCIYKVEGRNKKWQHYIAITEDINLDESDIYDFQDDLRKYMHSLGYNCRIIDWDDCSQEFYLGLNFSIQKSKKYNKKGVIV